MYCRTDCWLPANSTNTENGTNTNESVGGGRKMAARPRDFTRVGRVSRRRSRDGLQKHGKHTHTNYTHAHTHTHNLNLVKTYDVHGKPAENGRGTDERCVWREKRVPTDLVALSSALLLRFPYPSRGVAKSKLNRTLLADSGTPTSPALRFVIRRAPSRIRTDSRRNKT